MKILFKVEIPNLTINKFAKLVTFARQNGIKYSVEDQILVETKKEANGRTGVGLDDFVMLGDTSRVNEGTLADDMIGILAGYEKKKGAGSMTKRQLRDAVGEYSDAPDAVIGLALKNGVIRGI